MTAPSVADRTVTTGAPSPSRREERAWLIGTLIVGGAVRLLAALISSPTPGDDVGRLIVAAINALTRAVRDA